MGSGSPHHVVPQRELGEARVKKEVGKCPEGEEEQVMSYPFDCITNFIFVETEMAPADVILVPGSNHLQLMES